MRMHIWMALLVACVVYGIGVIKPTFAWGYVFEEEGRAIIVFEKGDTIWTICGSLYEKSMLYDGMDQDRCMREAMEGEYGIINNETLQEARRIPVGARMIFPFSFSVVARAVESENLSAAFSAALEQKYEAKYEALEQSSRALQKNIKDLNTENALLKKENKKYVGNIALLKARAQGLQRTRSILIAVFALLCVGVLAAGVCVILFLRARKKSHTAPAAHPYVEEGDVALRRELREKTSQLAETEHALHMSEKYIVGKRREFEIPEELLTQALPEDQRKIYFLAVKSEYKNSDKSPDKSPEVQMWYKMRCDAEVLWHNIRSHIPKCRECRNRISEESGFMIRIIGVSSESVRGHE